MSGVAIALGVAGAAVALVAGAMPFYFFDFALLRKEPMDLSDPAQTKGTPYEACSLEIAKAYEFLKDKTLENWNITARDGVRLHARLLPAQGEGKGLIVLVHGYHSAALQDFSCVLPFYHRLGYHLLLIDQRAHGESGGRYITFGHMERYDVVCWLEEVVRRYGTDLPLFLDGISMGASTVMLCSSIKLPGKVRGIIADCGYTTPIAQFTHVLRRQFRLPAFPLIPLVGRMAKKRADFDFHAVDTRAELAKSRYPLLFIHGKNDSFVPPYMSEENYAACRTEKKLLLIDGADHGGSYLADRETCERALAHFLDVHTPSKGKRRG